MSDLSPNSIRAVITTKWTNAGYRAVTVSGIESYRIDTQMDNDSDSFLVTIGDPKNVFGAALNRDNEIRVQILGLGKGVTYLHTGIADDIEFDYENRLVINGRDVSSIAVDTIARPGKWKQIRASDFIRGRATGKYGSTLNMPLRFDLRQTRKFGTIATDGSETEWEFWYRLIRHGGYWLWVTPDGVLRADKLNYNSDPSYYFGTPPPTASGRDRSKWIPVETVQYRKTTQTRIGDVEVVYHQGTSHVRVPVKDKTTDSWLKRPYKLLENNKLHTRNEAMAFLYEEIFESKVGALEIKVTIPDIGTVIRQNTIAELRIPEVDLGGKWFVVGSTVTADENGFLQEVRLREKGYAISKRVPDDPEVTGEPRNPPVFDECPSLKSFIPNHPEWYDYFQRAAIKHSKGFAKIDWVFFMAVLLGICDTETGFRNVRSNVGGNGTSSPGWVGLEWYKFSTDPFGLPLGILPTTIDEWATAFANEKGKPYLVMHPTTVLPDEFAVGPMQLFTRGYKENADRYDGGTVDQLYGNRWNPEWNIMEAARVLAGWVSGCGVVDPEEIWVAVSAYNMGHCGDVTSYGETVKRSVMGADGWYERLKNARSPCVEDQNNPSNEFEDSGAADAARKILQYKAEGKYKDGNGQQTAQLEATAAGRKVRNQCGAEVYIDASPLNAVLFLLDSNYLVGTYALVSDHSCNTARHPLGFAVDISHLGADGAWGVIGDGTKFTTDLVMSAMKRLGALSKGSGKPNQLICNGNGRTDPKVQALQLNNYQPDSYITGDHTDHIHVGY